MYNFFVYKTDKNDYELPDFEKPATKIAFCEAHEQMGENDDNSEEINGDGDEIHFWSNWHCPSAVYEILVANLKIFPEIGPWLVDTAVLIIALGSDIYPADDVLTVLGLDRDDTGHGLPDFAHPDIKMAFCNRDDPTRSDGKSESAHKKQRTI